MTYLYYYSTFTVKNMKIYVYFIIYSFKTNSLAYAGSLYADIVYAYYI